MLLNLGIMHCSVFIRVTITDQFWLVYYKDRTTENILHSMVICYYCNGASTEVQLGYRHNLQLPHPQDFCICNDLNSNMGILIEYIQSYVYSVK